MKTKNLLFALLAFIASLPVLANQEFTYTDPNGVVWTYEFVDETDPSQGIVITSKVSTTEGLVLPLEINDGTTRFPVVGITLSLEGMTSIPDNCFEGCANLTSVVIPNTVTSIGNNAFAYCRKLSSVSIPASVTSIGDGAFAFCPLTSVTIPNSVVSIGSMAFLRTGLTSVVIPESVTSIGGAAFDESPLTSITIPKSVTHIGGPLFRGCGTLTSIIVDEENEVYDSRDNCNAIIEKASNTLLMGCKGTVIPSTVTTIAEGSFDSMALTSLSIPQSVTRIEGNAFSVNPGISSIIIAKGNPVFDSRENSNAIIETASNTLLLGCQSTIIPSTVTSIGSNAFSNCWNLTNITIPGNVVTIGENAFWGCHLTTVTISEGVVNIGNTAFCQTPLTSIVIPSTVTNIGDGAFSENIDYDNGGESTIVSIEVSDGNTVYDSRNGCNAIIETASNTLVLGCKKTTIPSSVTSIGNRAFYGAQFTSISNDPSDAESDERCLFISSSVTRIGSHAFDSALTTVILPETLTELGDDAFGEGVTTLVSNLTKPFEIDSSGPSGIGVATGCVLHIPAGTRAAYAAAGWTENVFGGGIVEDGETAPDFVSVSLGSVGAGTFCSKYDLDFSATDDVKAYIVSAFLPKTGEVTLTRIKYVPAYTGIVLLGNEGDYSIPVTSEQVMVANLLKGITVRTLLNRIDGKYTNFILSKEEGVLGFYTVADGSTLPAGRAYLPLLTTMLPQSAAPKLSIRFDDGDATQVDEMLADDEAEVWRDLSGRTLIGQPKEKGVYMVNGKKVIVR